MTSPQARLTAKAACVLFCISLPAPQNAWAQQDPPPAAAAAVTADQSAAALEGAHQALVGLAGSKSLPEVADHLTDRAACVMGIIFTIPIAFGIGFSNLGVTKEKPSPDPDLQKDFTAFLTKYVGDPEKTPPMTGLPEGLKGRGREFIAGLMDFEKRVDKLSTEKSKDDGFNFSQQIPTDPTKYKFTVISPTEVRIVPAKGNKLELPGVVALSAIQEDGQWRIDFGDPVVILKAMQDATKSPTAPKTDPMADKMIDAVKAHNMAAVKQLLHKNPKLVNAQDFVGESALYNTIFNEDLPMATFLIAHGANVNAPNHFGKTPLDEAIFWDRKPFIALLKKHGAKPGPKQNNNS